MNSSRQVICTNRVRRVPAQFSWVDQRLVRDRHLDHLDVYAAALYLFLVTVADARGLSWYGDVSTARRLAMDEVRLRRARDDLIRAGLLAYERSLYQLLALKEPLPPPAPQQVAVNSVASPVSVTSHVMVQEHLAALHAVIGRRT
jgi:hypothetical protein